MPSEDRPIQKKFFLNWLQRLNESVQPFYNQGSFELIKNISESSKTYFTNKILFRFSPSFLIKLFFKTLEFVF